MYFTAAEQEPRPDNRPFTEFRHSPSHRSTTRLLLYRWLGVLRETSNTLSKITVVDCYRQRDCMFAEADDQEPWLER